ncbi:hypothetical protein NQ314_011548 [Rhamnusium bicolor]|uniref:Rad51-like C-terminal domain-containing protein n=1 Tax=Rhamnusium bicolor TaxID=1586634 RepID=A0AAV8XIE6_9CUCU|nr:hypothetical protein NQ314_011548 [Rhamnusium bicolor]
MEQNLSSLNLPKNIIAHLKTLGYNYVSDLEPNVLPGKLELQSLSKSQKRAETKTAFDLYQAELLNGCILSYNEKLDCILQNVIIPKALTEFAGMSGSGKTQVWYKILILKDDLKKLNTNFITAFSYVYLSSYQNVLSSILELTKKFIEQYNSLKAKLNFLPSEFNEEFVLKHIHYIKINDGLELISCIECLESYLSGKNIRLIVIDSISYPMRLLDVKERTTMISKLFRDLQNLASEYNFSIVVTNDLTTRVNKGESYATPSFGDSFYHLVTNRILLSKVNNSFHGKIVKSILHNQKETDFYL